MLRIGKRRLWFSAAAGAVLVVLVAVGLCLLVRKRPPTDKERAAALLEELRNSYVHLRREGSLRREIRRSVGASKEALERIIGRRPYYRPQQLRRDEICREIVGLGPEALPVLVDALKDEDLRYPACTALRGFGREAVVPVVALLKDSDPVRRIAAAESLGFIGPVAKDAVPALVEALRDDNSDLRWEVVIALGLVCCDRPMLGTNSPRKTPSSPFDGRDEAAVLALCTATKDKCPKVRRQAAEALSRFGPSAEGAVPYLRGLLKDDDATVRWWADFAMDRIISPEVGPSCANPE